MFCPSGFFYVATVFTSGSGVWDGVGVWAVVYLNFVLSCLEFFCDALINKFWS